MKKKGMRIAIALAVLAALVIGYGVWSMQDANDYDKEITITVVDARDKEKELYSGSFETNAKTLGELLKEVEKNGDLKIDMSDSSEGAYITGMGKDKIIEQDANNGYYWMYSSKNNKACKEAGFCTGIDQLVIQDKDAFEFRLEQPTFE